ncbi:MAG: M50 family metallopeptidase [Chloroflexota bacterium]
MDVVGTIAAFLVVLVLLVLVHEFGHFIVAKRAGITVQEFGIGFPPRITSIVWRGTRYSLNWIPLGGFVKMLGEDGDREAQKMRERGLSEAAVDKAMAGAFNRKPIWVRMAVLLAGVVMNFILAGALFSIVVGLPQVAPRGGLVIEDIQARSPAQAAGLQPGDVILSADGRTFMVPSDLTAYVRGQAGHKVSLQIRRDGAIEQVSVKPRPVTEAEANRGIGAVGFSWSPERLEELPPIAQNALQALSIGFGGDGATGLALQLPGALSDAVGGLLGLNPDAGQAVGPIGIAEQTGRVLEGPLVGMLYFVGILSLNLAVLNVLPFPPLDGGRILVVVIEAVRRRKLPAEREALIYLTGFMVLIALVILISIQDVQRLIEG